MTLLISAALWLGAYLALVLAPLLVLLIGPLPPGSGFWWDFSMALGFAAMSMMGVQFLLTARFRRATAPFGIDIIYSFHRYLALFTLTFICLHYLVIRINNPVALGVFNPLEAPWYLTFGRLALLLLTLIIVSSLWRKPLGIHYDEWRKLHIGLSVAIFLLALGHIEGVGYYIDAPVRRGLWTGYTLLWMLLILYVRLVKPWRMHNRPYQVVEVRPEHGNSWTLALQPVGHGGMRFMPGQFAWLSLRASPWQVREHPFSISSSAARQDRVEFTIKGLGDFTCTINQTRIGELAYLDGPYGIFSVDQYLDAPGFVFVAGGVGAAPIMSILRTLADRQDQRPLWFFYGNSRWDNVIFREELEALKPRLNLHLVHVLSQPPADDWQGESGLITPALLKKLLPEETRQYEYFLCGPRPMSESVQRGLRDLQVPLDRIHYELFDLV
jgi:predicted ferric reductase